MIRSFGLRDIPALSRLQSRGMAFDLRRLLLYAPSPLASALLGYATRFHLGATTWMHVPGHYAARGAVQVWPRAERDEWDLGFLSPALAHDDAAAQAWQEMLGQTVVYGAQQGVQRIYARLTEDAEAEDGLRQAGFTTVAREEVFVASRPPAPAPLPLGLRRVDRHDRPALSAFYRQVVPHLVQQAEGYSPHWGATETTLRRMVSLVSTQEFIWLERGHIQAYLGLCGSSRGYWLETIVRPENRAEVLPYIRYVMTLADCTPATPVYSPVPDFGVGLGWLFRTLGFETFTRQVLMVVHTLARVPVRRPLFIHSLEGGVDVGTSVGHTFRRPAWLWPRHPAATPTARDVLLIDHPDGAHGRPS